MDCFLPKLKLALFLLVINHTLPCFRVSAFQKADPLPTQGTTEGFPFISSWNESDQLGYSGDSFTSQTNRDLAALLDFGALANDTDTRVPVIPPLDGYSSSATWPRNQYAMKFVAYDMRLGKLKAVNPLGRSFSIQLQMFLQWQEWLTNQTETDVPTESCNFFCDNTRNQQGLYCCDNIWLPALRFPNADVAQMDSIVTRGRGLVFSLNDPNTDCQQPENPEVFGNAVCFRQRFWELSLEAECEANMEFRKFPWDFQQLSLDIRNPFSSRTLLQFGSGSLEARANNLIQKNCEDGSGGDWRIIDVIVLPLCDALSWKSTFFSIDAQLVNKIRHYTSQRDQIEKRLETLTCNLVNSWSDDLSRSQLDPANTTAYASIKQDYSKRLNNTRDAYKQCLREKGFANITTTSNEFRIDFGWIDYFDDPELKGSVSIPCLIDAVANMTTPGIRVSILVKRYQMYYFVKLIIPVVVCVLFAFTVVAIEVREVGNRLAVVVPAAISLTALQVLVVATDIPVISYIVPTTWLMLSSYLVILLICVEAVIVRILWNFQSENEGKPATGAGDSDAGKTDTGAGKKSEEMGRTAAPHPTGRKRWTDARYVDIGLLGMIFVLYLIIFVLCILVPARNTPPPMPGGVSIWRRANNVV